MKAFRPAGSTPCLLPAPPHGDAVGMVFGAELSICSGGTLSPKYGRNKAFGHDIYELPQAILPALCDYQNRRRRQRQHWVSSASDTSLSILVLNFPPAETRNPRRKDIPYLRTDVCSKIIPYSDSPLSFACAASINLAPIIFASTLRGTTGLKNKYPPVAPLFPLMS